MKIKTHKYKILVLSDLSSSSRMVLKSTVSLAKMIDGSIELFHVKKLTDIVEIENQLSAMRTINQEQNVTSNKIRDLIAPISKDYDVNINHTFSFGNVKHEIEEYIKEHQPDIIVLGKRKSKAFNLIGDNITDFVLKKHNGVIMIAADKNPIEPNEAISLGVLNGLERSFNLDFADDLIGHTQKPLKSFKIVKNSNTSEEIQNPSDKKIVEYVFEQGDNVIKNLSNYLSKNNINLFCLDRGKKNANENLINKLNVSLLVTSDLK